jgi:hypothetical protein
MQLQQGERVAVPLVDARCGGPRKDEIVSAGSYTGLELASPGTRVAAALDGIGRAKAEV